jgi:hypothetical protein
MFLEGEIKKKLERFIEKSGYFPDEESIRWFLKVLKGLIEEFLKEEKEEGVHFEDDLVEWIRKEILKGKKEGEFTLVDLYQSQLPDLLGITEYSDLIQYLLKASDKIQRVKPDVFAVREVSSQE